MADQAPPNVFGITRDTGAPTIPLPPEVQAQVDDAMAADKAAREAVRELRQPIPESHRFGGFPQDLRTREQRDADKAAKETK